MRPLLIPFVLLLGLGTITPLYCASPPQPAPWAQNALQKEADFIVNCSFTEFTKNNSGVRDTADAYGTINVDRIYQKGPDWVRPGEGTMGAIGLMAAAIQLKAAGVDISQYDQVLDRYFENWLLTKRQPVNADRSSLDYGGVFERVYYDTNGNRTKNDAVNAGVTGQIVSAMWKYYEYNVATGSNQTANNWLRDAWPMARQGGDFIQRNYDATYQLVRSNSGSSNLWVTDGTYSAMALRCLDRWAVTAGQAQPFGYSILADSIVQGIQGLKDNGVTKNFFRYRDGSRASSLPTYGDRIDQICFLPYEADVLDPGEPFSKAISDWWTNGSDGIRLTVQTSDPTDWRSFGTHYRYTFASTPENNLLYPGPGLQLAKVEWKYAQKTGDPVTLDRARKRLQWALSDQYSHLWLGGSGVSEAGVSNGLVDWRDATNYAHKADNWARFVDTSAYCIESVLMLEYGTDTQYVPRPEGSRISPMPF